MSGEQHEKECPRNDARRYSRRRFFNLIGWGSMSALVVGMSGASIRYLIPNRTGPSENSFKVGRPEQFTEKVTYINGKRTFMIRTDSGLRALSATCTHLGCTVNWVPEDNRIECPCHGSIFDEQTGEVLGGPAPRPLDWYRLVLMEDGDLLVDPDDLVEASSYLVV